MIALISRRVLTICAICCVLITAALLIGTTIPIPAHTSLFTRSLCALPCLYGITPGISTRDQARQTFSPSALSYAMISTDQPFYILRQTDEARSMLVLIDFGSATSPTVHAIQLYPQSPTYALGTLSDFMLAGYEPTHVFMNCQSPLSLLITLGGDHIYAEIALTDPFAPDTPITLLGTVDSDAALTRSLDQFGCRAESRWSGFAATWKYGSPP